MFVCPGILGISLYDVSACETNLVARIITDDPDEEQEPCPEWQCCGVAKYQSDGSEAPGAFHCGPQTTCISLAWRGMCVFMV